MANLPRLFLAHATLGACLVLVAGCCKKSGGGDDGASTNAAPEATESPPVAQPQTKPMTGASGTACTNNGWFGCSPDGLHEVQCVNGNWVNFRTCRGPNHCRHNGTVTRCDYGPLMPGDTCSLPLKAMCTADHKGIMGCTGGRMSVIQTCTGGQTCQRGGTPRCK